MTEQTITDFVNSLTTDTINVRGKKYSLETLKSYHTVIKNAFKTQNIDINTIDFENTDITSKLIDAITPPSYIPKLLGIIRVYRPDLIYYSSMVEQVRSKQIPLVFDQDITGLSDKINTITDPIYKLLFKIMNTSKGVRRMGDYHSLKINNFDKKTDNYITVGGRLVFNDTVKTGDIQLSPEITRFCRLILRPLKKTRDTFFSENRNVYNKRTSKITGELGLKGGASQLRKAQYKDPQNRADLEASERIQEVANNSGHSLETIRQHYL